MKTNANKNLTSAKSRAKYVAMRNKVKNAKRIGVGGYVSNAMAEFFNTKRFGMGTKEEALALLEEGDVILGNEKFDLSKDMFRLSRHWTKRLVLSVNGEEEQHGWIGNAVDVFGLCKLDADSVDKAIAACSVMNSMHKLYGHQCWFKYSTARVAIELGASEEEAFWMSHHITYQQYSLLVSDEVQVRDLQDLWYILRIDDEMAIRLGSELFQITEGGSIPAKTLFAYGEDLLDRQRHKVTDRNKRFSDDIFYEEMYPRLYRKGYWELDSLYYSTINLVKEGKNRLAKLQPDVFRKNIMEAISATGIDKSKFKALAPQCEDVLCELFSVLQNKEFKSFVKSYSGVFDSVTDAMCKMLNSKGVKVEASSVLRDYWNTNTPGCFDALVEFLPELRGKTVNFNTPRSIIERFAMSGFESLSGYADIMNTGLDPDEKTEPSSLLRSIKAANVAEMDMWVLPKGDPRNLTIGDLTGCCQRVGGAGEYVCLEGWTDPYSVNVVFGNRSEDVFHAHAWAWQTSDGDIVLDSIEGRSFVDHIVVSKLVLELATQMKEKCVKVFLSNTSYGLTRDVVSRLRREGYISQGVCPYSVTDYSYMDTWPGDECWLIKV